MKDTVKILDTTMDLTDENNTFEKTLLDLNKQAEEAVREGYVHIILSDKNLSKDRVAANDLGYKFCSLTSYSPKSSNLHIFKYSIS